jgi:hypothetical protein
MSFGELLLNCCFNFLYGAPVIDIIQNDFLFVHLYGAPLIYLSQNNLLISGPLRPRNSVVR